mmetsp:Transcript_10177/g.15622  ORF Transcript_10177/g.15622 Transcript_10177/m.15622 type:complete len:1079 (-) Transcript_10177:1319-4555(-)
MPSPTRNSVQLPQKSSSPTESKKQEDRTKSLSSNTVDYPDKENVTKTNDIQPPSPLTSKRSKGTKSSSSHKSFGPRDTNIWGPHTSMDSTSGAARRLRSSPIHREKPEKFQDQVSGERRELSQHPGNLKSDMSYSIAGDLEHMIKDDDDFSTSIGDFPNLGTFDEDSPAKDLPTNYQERPISPPRGSPSDHGEGYGYRSSPSSYGRHPGYSSSYYYDQPRGYAPTYYQHPRYGDQSHQPWSSPPAYDYSGEKQHMPLPPSAREYDQGNMTSPIKKKPRWDRDRTPERLSKPSKSPFRSPSAQNNDSSKKFKRSPSIWGGGSTPNNIGMYGSFDTPSGTGAYLDEFSPMGPIFKPFDKGDSPPMPIEGEVLDDRLKFVSENDSGPPMRQPPSGSSQRHDPFVNDLAHMPGTIPVPNSPMRSNKDRESSQYFGEKDRESRPTPSHSSLKRPPSGSSKRHYFTSPMARSHYSSSKRDPWYGSSRQNPGPVRLELGEMGVKPSDARKSFEGINNMLRGSSASGHPNYSSEKSRSRGYHDDLNTPVKIDGQPGSRPPMSQSRNHVTPYPPSGSGPMATPMSGQGSRYPNHSSNMGHSGKPSRSSMKTPSSSKEKVVTPASERRNPCNCKKSKCLKLYCECFAAELFCDGCNCNDCKNTKEYEDERNKAMKDTRAKNPNAFKPRIAVRGNVGRSGASPSSEHNMGCKCKRSQCLKKYCECFQAGVMCNSSKCKCVDCLNYVGSQALIDKRRKIKDHRGADFAMRIADEAWKSGKHGPPPVNSSSASSSRGGRKQPGLSPNASHHSRGGHHMPLPPHMMHPSPPSHGPPGAPPMYPPMMMGHPPVGYSMAMHPSSKPYTHGQKSGSQQRKRSQAASPQRNKKQKNEKMSNKSHSGMGSHPSDGKENTSNGARPRPETTGKTEVKSASFGPNPIMAVVTPAASKPNEISGRSDKDSSRETESYKVKETNLKSTPCVTSTLTKILPPTTPSTVKPGSSIGSKADVSRMSTPRTPGVRLGYDPTSSKKKRLSPGEKEATFPYFGRLPEQPKTTALAVFSFLSNDEIYNAGLVCRKWSRLAMDEELWQF